MESFNFKHLRNYIHTVKLIVPFFVFLDVNLASTATRPNIVVIVADDLGWNDVSFHGSDQIPTPNIDKLASEGITLNNYYVQPICTPTRSALLTGRHPIHTGMQHGVIVGSQPYGLPLSEKLLPQYLKELGYINRMVGKWHLGFFKDEYLPTRRGFDSHFGYWLGCEDYFDHTSSANSEYWGHDFHRDLSPVTGHVNQYSTDLYSQEAVDIISHHNTSQPLFLYLPHQAVHSGNSDGDPLQAPQHYVDRFPHILNDKRRIFAGMVSALDDAVGELVTALATRKMTNNTIILFTTDNGGPSNGFDYNAASNWPLRGVKATYWEGGLRGVGFIHSALLKHSRYISNNLIHVTDWLPTLVAAAGGNITRGSNLDGRDVWDMLSKNSAPVRTEILHNIDPAYRDNAALRVGEYKLVMGAQMYSRWNDWYPPWQAKGDGQSRPVFVRENADDFVDGVAGMRDSPDRSANVVNMERMLESLVAAGDETPDDNLRYKRNNRHDDVVVSAHSRQEAAEDDTRKASKPDGSTFRSDYTVKCGAKPENASTNCQPRLSPCLFHILSDPCEYNNIAASYPAKVEDMIARLEYYIKSMVPPGNKRIDPAGNPKYHDGYWVPWLSKRP